MSQIRKKAKQIVHRLNSRNTLKRARNTDAKTLNRLLRANESLSKIVEGNFDCFIDTSCLHGGNGRYGNYLTDIQNIHESCYLEVLASYSESMVKILGRDNVYIIPEVAKEFRHTSRNTIEILKEAIKPKELKRYVKGKLNDVREAVTKNSERYLEQETDDDPIIEKITNLIPNTNGHKIISGTDKRIIAVAVARSLSFGGKYRIIGADRDILVGMKELKRSLETNPFDLDLSGFGGLEAGMVEMRFMQQTAEGPLPAYAGCLDTGRHLQRVAQETRDREYASWAKQQSA